MLAHTTRLSLLEGLQNLQDRVAAQFSGQFYEHKIVLTVMYTTFQGHVLDSVTPPAPSSSRNPVIDMYTGTFGNGAMLSTRIKQMAAMREVALSAWNAFNEDSIVVNATFQVTVNGRAIDRTIQVYIQDGQLIVREVDTVDNSVA